MTPERWQQLRGVLDRALETPPEQRDQWLRDACAGDATLRAELDRLLEAESRAGLLLESPVGEFAGSLVRDIADLEPALDPMLGRLVGPYRLVRWLARGGMGTVYLAERVRGQFQQQVAIKVLQLGLDSGDLLRHFLAERQILAALAHPGIARLLDGGATDDGRPYLVLEYVQGLPIDAYCDAHRLTVPERLRRFLDVAAAVQYAHRNLVVHRDLKPSNILVTESGEVKLLDFGIAKLLEGDAAPAVAAPTRPGVRMMTPEYASPEQVRGEPISTASDVYQLGLLLYELVAGRRPYRVAGLSPSETERVICTVEPPPPSRAVTRREEPDPDGSERDERPMTPGDVAAARRTTPGRLRKQLEGDLDAIVLQAIRKEPHQRYPSAEALSDDLHRSLAGLPVRARGDTPGYRARRFARRHRWPLAAAASLVLMLAGYAATVSIQSGRVRQALGQAQLEAEKSREVTDFLLGLFQATDPAEALGDTLTAWDLLERGEARVAALADQPEVQAGMLHVLGTVYLSLGRYDRAGRLLERAVGLRQTIYRGDHAELATSQDRLAAALQEQGDYAAAEPLFREALAMRRRLFGDRHQEVSRSLNNLAVLLHFKGDYGGAEPLYREALALKRELLGDEHPDLATGMQNLGLVLRDQGNYDSAEPLLRGALAMRRRLLGDDHPRVAASINFLAGVLRRTGNLDSAEVLYREVLALRRRVLGEEHPDVAQSLNNLAIVLGDRGDYPAAEAVLRDALALRRKLLGEEHPEVAFGLQNLGWVLKQRGDYRQAERLLREALAMRRKLLGNEHPDVAYTLTTLGDVLVRQGRAGLAEPLLRQALAIRQRHLQDDDWLLATTRTVLGAGLTALGRYAEAEPLLLGSLKVLEERFGPDDRRTEEARNQVGRLYESWGRRGDAEQYLLSGSPRAPPP